MPRGRSSNAFSRIDAIVIAVTLIVLIGWLLVWRHVASTWSERAPCIGNLKQIGAAIALYSHDNGARLPFAGLRLGPGQHWSWDDLINKQLGGNFSKRQLEMSEPTVDMPVLRCPSDRVDIAPELAPYGGHRRTYAMPAHNMTADNWPPGPANKTGIGILWNLGGKAPSPDYSNKWVFPAGKGVDLGQSTQSPRQLTFTTAMIPSPSKTIALTEFNKADNIIGHFTRAAISTPSDQIQAARAQSGPIHEGKFSYLFLDGHAESMEPLKTLSPKLQYPTMSSGMWWVNKNDR